MSRKLKIVRFESEPAEERSDLTDTVRFEHREEFDFEVWAAAVRQQLLAVLRK
jgi:hypothetical protein